MPDEESLKHGFFVFERRIEGERASCRADEIHDEVLHGVDQGGPADEVRASMKAQSAAKPAGSRSMPPSPQQALTME